jgi:hypothetical protein
MVLEVEQLVAVTTVPEVELEVSVNVPTALDRPSISCRIAAFCLIGSFSAGLR